MSFCSAIDSPGRQHRAERRPGRPGINSGEFPVISGRRRSPVPAAEDRRDCAAGPGTGRLLVLAVVLLAIDEAALAIVGVVQVPELAAAEIAVGERAVGRVVEP